MVAIWFLLVWGGPARVVLVGGGAESDIGDPNGWSVAPYSALLAGGDTNMDGEVRVVILGTNDQPSTFLTQYFVWLGNLQMLNVTAFELPVPDRTAANAKSVREAVELADALFIRGGDQGVYYDEWNDTALDQAIHTVLNRGGSIGGTSAGSMSLAEFAFAGGRDLVSGDVLHDAHTPYLDDADGGSGIHNDFLSILPGICIDSHFTWRGRLGRLAGILAKAEEDFQRFDLVGIGVEEKTALVITGSQASVFGLGSALFLHRTNQTENVRIPGKPLIYTYLAAHRLVQGWRFDLLSRIVTPDGSAVPVPTLALVPENNPWNPIMGDGESAADQFEWKASWDPFSLTETQTLPTLYDSVGFGNAGASNNRGYKHESLWRALFDRPQLVGYLLWPGGQWISGDDPDFVYVSGGSGGIVVSLDTASWMGLNSYFPSQNGVDFTAAFDQATLHVIGDTLGGTRFWYPRRRLLGLQPNGAGLSLLIDYWGQNRPELDIVQNGSIDVLDLAFLLSQFEANL
ncbi:MAG: cyanophycinase [Acidobacteria bacterium]|nr:cyanophycinase [Acidobacteriota bacterium]MCB9397248.1 cyanophycinase [Acidobacteriota bacterium]